MSIQEMHELFDIVQDKYNEKYFTSSEKDVMLNRAHLMAINEIIFGEYYVNGINVISGIEFSETQSSLMMPLMVSEEIVSSSASSLITMASINSAIQSKYGDNSELMFILDITSAPGNTEITPETNIGYVRFNDYQSNKSNTFKKATVLNPKFLLTSNGYSIKPSAPSQPFYISCIKSPRKVDIGGSVNSELPVQLHDKIVAIALELAGVATESQVLATMNKSY